MKWFAGATLLCCAILVPVPQALAQPRETRMLITVIDQTNSVIPGATVTVIGAEPATQKVEYPPVQTDGKGMAVVSGLSQGRYTARAEYSGFYPGLLKEVRVRPGDNRHIIVLLVENFQETVNVAQDAQAGAADRRGESFGSALTREQMDALSDDPDEMQRQLQDMAGPGSIIRIDSFEGGRLPPKAMIKSIRVTRDQFAAENHSSEGIFIDVITQPGIGPVRTNMNYNMRSSAMSARNAFTPTKGEDQDQNYWLNIGGGLIENRLSFSLGAYGNSAFDTPNIAIARSDGATIRTLKERMPRESVSINGRMDYSLTRDQTLRVSYNNFNFLNKNQGIGGFNEPERGFVNENHTHTFRIQEVGPLARRFFMNSRLNIGWTDFESRSVVEARTITVLDRFSSGGAQRAGGRHSRDINFGGDLDYVRGIHSLRVGTQIDANWFRSDDTSNYLGTYTFETIEAFNAGRPRSYTQRVGDPRIDYFNLQAAFYAQDDIRIRRNLTFTPGVRYEKQSLIKGNGVIGPRAGITWAPFKNGKTTLRVSYGVFYDWLQNFIYEQTLRVDGFRQRELNLLNPSYPDPTGSIAVFAPANRYQLSPELKHPRSNRVSSGVDYAFTPRIRANVTYRYVDQKYLLRGVNLNGPVNGVRPMPEFANVVEVISDGRGRQHLLQFGGSTTPTPPPPATAPRWDFKRFAFFGNYTIALSENNTDGAFSTPATGNLIDEWGTAAGHARHRYFGGIYSEAFRSVGMQVWMNGSSAVPYTIQTGFDDNGDLIFNDRPTGVARNTGRTSAQYQLNMWAGYSFTFGPRLQLPPGVWFSPGSGGSVQVTTVTMPEQGRYRMSINFQVQNLTNRANYIGYSGILTSPFYGRPTQAQNARRMMLGFGLGF
jgi:hypothetical protein